MNASAQNSNSTPPTPAARTAPAALYRERLWPSPWLYVALLLLAPAGAMATFPLFAAAAIPVGIGLYVLIAGIITTLSPLVSVEGGMLHAATAKIPVTHLGEMQHLGPNALRRAIGTELDARAHLMIRGWIHQGLRIEVTDPNDPTPYWIVTTRNIEKLARAIQTAKAEAGAGQGSN